MHQRMAFQYGEVTAVCKYARSHARVICSETQIGWEHYSEEKCQSNRWIERPPRTIYEKPRNRHTKQDASGERQSWNVSSKIWWKFEKRETRTPMERQKQKNKQHKNEN